jgi:ABC-2 type transport system permease protein
MLRERTTGTLERLLTMPFAKLDLLLGYALAFGLMAVLQIAIASAVAFGLLGLDSDRSAALVAAVALINALLGVAFGLFVSAFARTEFQAVQMLPVVLLPQFLLCGFIVPQDELPLVLGWLSWLMPLTYGMNAVFEAMEQPSVTAYYLVNLGVVLAFALAALAVGGLTLRRQTR